jgi:YHS domain-containing protein
MVVVGFFRFFLYVIIAYAIYSFLRLLMSPRRSTRSEQSRPQLSGVMVKDEICNTYLPKDEALLEKADGEDHYFCSQECRRKFLEQRKNRG